VDKKEEKSKNFKRLAEKRVTRVLEDLRILGNLSNKSLYNYSDVDIRRIFTAIDDAVKDAKASFRPGQRKKGKEFKL